MANKFRKFMGSALDKVGTALHLPEMGLSEAYSGGATQNTGTKTLNTFLTPAPTERYFNDTAYGQPVTGKVPQAGAVGNASTQPANGGGAATGGAGAPSLEQMLAAMGSGGAGAGGGGGGGGSAAVELPRDIRNLNGQYFDLSNPGQRDGYYRALAGMGDDQIRNEISKLDDQLSRAVKSGEISYEEKATTLDQAMKRLSQDEQDYELDHDKRVTEFDEGNRMNAVKRDNAFAAMAPLAFQSAQGDEARADETKRVTGLSEFKREATVNKGRFDESKGNLIRNKTKLVDAYTGFREDLDRQRRESEQELRGGVEQFKQGTASELATADALQGTDFNGKYQVDAEVLKTPEYMKVDTAPYVNAFSGIGGQAGVTSGNPFANIPGAKSQEGEDQYLEYNEDEKKKRSQVQQYLYA